MDCNFSLPTHKGLGAWFLVTDKFWMRVKGLGYVFGQRLAFLAIEKIPYTTPMEYVIYHNTIYNEYELN